MPTSGIEYRGDSSVGRCRGQEGAGTRAIQRLRHTPLGRCLIMDADVSTLIRDSKAH